MPGPSEPDPFRELQREMGRLLDALPALQAWRVGHPFPAMNLLETSDRYILTAELPGLTSNEIELSVAGQSLTIRGERSGAAVRDDAYRRKERGTGTWSRTYSFPTRVDAEGIAAVLARGVLVVELPKAEDVRVRRIAVTMTPE
jgi:HSP20 family protein